jgi:protein tyrosine phosphatase
LGLQFLRLMHLYHATGPFLVHCSAGIGRSGVLMAVDAALARIENGADPGLFDLACELRRQRYGMIQTQVKMK